MARMAFEKLDVYRLSERLADAVWDLSDQWKLYARDTVGTLITELGPRLNAYLTAVSRRQRAPVSTAQRQRLKIVSSNSK